MLKGRGLLHDSTSPDPPKPQHCYVGFDPTADSLHIGNLLQIIVLQHLSNHGYKPIALIGGATGQIGDPSGRSTERNLLSREEVDRNVAKISEVLNSTFEGSLTVCNNIDWYTDISMLQFLRDIGKEFRMNTMLEKDSVKSRLQNDDQGMSFTEFSYQILQSHDFFKLNEKYNCDLQFGGSDQWGNITSGIEYVKKKSRRQVYGFTIPLLTDEKGNKIGKSSEHNDKLWLSKEKTSIFNFYQYWVNIPDSQVEKLLKAFTFLELDEIERIMEEHAKNPELRHAQKLLARSVTKYIHKEKGLKQAELYTKIFFGDSDLSAVRVAEFEMAFEGTDMMSVVSIDDILNKDIIKVSTNFKIFPSQAQTKKFIESGGYYINEKKIDSSSFIITQEHIYNNHIDGKNEKFIVFRIGKKKFKILIIKE